jgi:hypothetical protein
MSLTTCYMCWVYDMDSASGACSRCLGVICDTCKQPLSAHAINNEWRCPTASKFTAKIPWSRKPDDVTAYYKEGSCEKCGRFLGIGPTRESPCRECCTKAGLCHCGQPTGPMYMFACNACGDRAKHVLAERGQ